MQIYRLELFPQPAATKSLADRDVTSNPLEVSAETTQNRKRKASACRLSVCPVVFSHVNVATSLVNKDDYIMYYVYTSVQSVIHTYDRLGRCFRFVYFMLVLLCFCVAAVSR